MGYLPNIKQKQLQKQVKMQHALDEKKRKKKGKKDFNEWRIKNPGKGIVEYIMKG